MKLYATTTSERASKGQGGNKFIKVRFTGKDEQDLGTVILELKQGTQNEFYYLYYNPRDGASQNIAVIPKGNKQKTAKHNIVEDEFMVNDEGVE